MLAPLLPRPLAAQTAGAADLRRVENYFNGLSTLKARFLQLDQAGGTAQGTAWIWRPGRMRFEYDPPVPVMLIAADNQFFHLDRELGQPSIVPVSSTPLAFLLRREMRFGGDVAVSGVERSGGFLRVTVQRTAAPAEGSLTMVLAEEPMELRQWVVRDPQGKQTRVTLSQIETGGRFDPLLFNFNDPRFPEAEAARRQ